MLLVSASVDVLFAAFDDKRESNKRMLFTRSVSTETPYLVSLNGLCTINSNPLSYCKAGTFFLHNKLMG